MKKYIFTTLSPTMKLRPTLAIHPRRKPGLPRPGRPASRHPKRRPLTYQPPAHTDLARLYHHARSRLPALRRRLLARPIPSNEYILAAMCAVVQVALLTARLERVRRYGAPAAAARLAADLRRARRTLSGYSELF